ncbi:MAG: hypothetical protein JNM30_01315 [Rhodospirillales bacterium]|nr:hypothetical protein [Rhodospirillales bacterium]
MTTEDSACAAGWLAAYVGTALPTDQLNAAVQATRRVSQGIGQRADALAMEDEPAGFRLGLERLALERRGAKR